MVDLQDDEEGDSGRVNEDEQLAILADLQAGAAERKGAGSGGREGGGAAPLSSSAALHSSSATAGGGRSAGISTTSSALTSDLADSSSSSSSTLDAQLTPAEAAALQAQLSELDQQGHALRDQQRKAARNMEGVTEDMREEVIALLQLFGIPYIVAPMEAEAQCAALQLAGLVDGVISDDSDSFLFGATTVYRNIFEERKYVEVYRMEDISSELGLDRQDLIRMALLLGSDYTEGITGVGPVNAVEIVQAFPGDEGMQQFADWLHSVDPAEDKKLKKAALASADPITRFKAKHRSARSKWQVAEGFPSKTVMNAYRQPQVTELNPAVHKFVWRQPDWNGLKTLCVQEFGWLPEKVEADLAPVRKELGSGVIQMTMQSYMKTYEQTERAAKIKSSRLQSAVKGLRGKEELEEDLVVLEDDQLAAAGRASAGGAAAAAGSAAAFSKAASKDGYASPLKKRRGLMGEAAQSSEVHKEAAAAAAAALSGKGYGASALSEQSGKDRGRGSKAGGATGKKGKPAASATASALGGVGGDDVNLTAADLDELLQDDWTPEQLAGTTASSSMRQQQSKPRQQHVILSDSEEEEGMAEEGRKKGAAAARAGGSDTKDEGEQEEESQEEEDEDEGFSRKKKKTKMTKKGAAAAARGGKAGRGRGRGR